MIVVYVSIISVNVYTLHMYVYRANKRTPIYIATDKMLLI